MAMRGCEQTRWLNLMQEISLINLSKRLHTCWGIISWIIDSQTNGVCCHLINRIGLQPLFHHFQSDVTATHDCHVSWTLRHAMGCSILASISLLIDGRLPSWTLRPVAECMSSAEVDYRTQKIKCYLFGLSCPHLSQSPLGVRKPDDWLLWSLIYLCYAF